MLTLAFKFLALAAPVWPNVFADQLNNSSSHSGASSYNSTNNSADLIEIFREEIVFFCVDRSSIISTASNTSNIANNGICNTDERTDDSQKLLSEKYMAYLTELFNAVESALLYCGGLLLSANVMSHIETSIGLGLVTLCKGVLPSQFSDRR